MRLIQKDFVSLHQNSNQTKDMAKVISIINDKGGVAKTTTTINLGTALWLLGKRVLMVDTDKQCNMTVTIDKTSYRVGVSTLYDWMKDDTIDPPVYERYEGLDYIPSSIRIDELNTWLADKVYRENYLSIRLNALRDAYDYILIDCAPGCNSILNKNAIAASDGVIVPVRTDLYSIQGKDAVRTIVDEINKMMGKHIELMGYLLTQFERTKMGKEVQEFFRQQPDTPVFPVPIRKCAKCNEAPKGQMSLFEYAADSTAADDYMRLAEQILDKKTRAKKWTPAAWSDKANKAFEKFIDEQE